MSFVRIFSGQAWKGTKHYLKSQRNYEIARTVLLFSISGALFAGGWLSTGTRLNLLTIVAVLGILPASKSLVSVIMFCRYHGLSDDKASRISGHVGTLTELYDLVFTSNDKNYEIGHAVIKGNSICGYSEKPNFEEQAFYKHLKNLLKIDHYNDVSIKVFTDLEKYVDRLDQMQELVCDEKNTDGIATTLKSVSL